MHGGRPNLGVLGLVTVAAAALSGCAGVYLNSPALETNSASAASAFPDETTALKPFDDQIAHLNDFAASEDLAVADYWTAVRDAHFARLIAMDVQQDRPRALQKQIAAGLTDVVGSTTLGPSPDLATDQASLKGEQDDMAKRTADLRALPGTADLSLACTDLTAQYSKDDAQRMAISRNAHDNALGAIVGYCRSIPDLLDKVTKEQLDLDHAQGELGQELKARTEAEKQAGSTGKAGEVATAVSKGDEPALQAAIDDASNFNANDAETKLTALEGKINGILDLSSDASAASKLLGWTKAAEDLDKLLQLKACNIEGADTSALNCPPAAATAQAVAAAPAAAAPAAAAPAAAAPAPAQTPQQQAAAIWATAQALARLTDVNDPRWRSAQWLIAAKAIVAAEQANAALQKDQWTALALTHGQRAAVLTQEAVDLRQAQASAQGARGDCHSGHPGGDTGPNPHCLLGAYVAAWNEGVVPAAVLAYHPVQLQRIFIVKRARIAAQRQRALAAAAIESLRAHGAGGLKAELIAQALFDAAAIGAAIGS